MDPVSSRALAILLTAGYFALAGILDVGSALIEIRPLLSLPLWDAAVRGGLHFVLGYGLLRRFAVCRSIAMIYCLAVVIMYSAIVLMALAQEPLEFPGSVVIQSLFHVPSGTLVFLYLRSPEASVAFPRPLFGGRPKPPTPTDRACSGGSETL